MNNIVFNSINKRNFKINLGSSVFWRYLYPCTIERVLPFELQHNNTRILCMTIYRESKQIKEFEVPV